MTIMNSVLLCVGGLTFGPLLITPIYLVGSLAAILTIAPTSFKPWVIVVAHILPITIDLVLELSGITPRTFSMDGSTLQLKSWVLELSPTALVIALLLAIVSQFVNTISSAVPARRAEEYARDRAHAQAWHLKQLDPRDEG
jgi:hypothetical protein